MTKRISLAEFKNKLELSLEGIGYQMAKEVKIIEDEILGFVIHKNDGFFYNFQKTELKYVNSFETLLPIEVEIMKKKGLIQKKKKK